MNNRINKVLALFSNWIPDQVRNDVFKVRNDKFTIRMKNKKGFSIIGSLLGFSLLGLSTVGLATYMGSFEEVKVQYARQSNVSFMHSELISSMEKIITMTQTEISGTTKTGHDKKKYGLCQIVTDSTDPNNTNKYIHFKDKAICSIMLNNGPILSVGNYANDRWAYFIKEGNNWEITAIGNCAGGTNGFAGTFPDTTNLLAHFQKCAEYTGTSETKGIYARLIMEPQSMPDFETITSSTDKIPVDELVYKFKSVISIPKELEANNPDNIVYSLSKGEKYLWSTEVLDCHICSGTNCKLARFSTASQGASARHSRICYHSPYKAREKKDSLEVVVEKISKEFTTSTDRIIATGTQPDYSSACRANLFRCNNQIDHRDFDPALKFRFLLNYDQPDDSYINQMDLKVTNGTDTREYGTLFVSADQKARIGRDKDGNNNTFSEQWPLRAGTNEVTAFIADRNLSSDSICTDICSASPSYYPDLTVKYGGANCDGSSNCTETLTASSNQIACYQCNMKSCHRYGVKTYKEDTRDEEPLDGSVPECVIEKSIPTSVGSADLTRVSGSDLDDLTHKCLQAGTGGLEPVSCTNTPDGGNPVFKTGTTKSACFSEGKTRILEGGYTGGLDARNNCLQVLQEEQLIGEKDANGVWKEGVLPSLSTAYGLAPSTGDPNNPGVKEILENIGGLPVVQTASGGKKYVFNNYARFATFWGDHSSVPSGTFVPVQRDASGMFHSGWVRYIGVANSGTTEERERWAFFYREPFSSINFHDADQVGNSLTLPAGVSRKDFLGRARPTRPVYIKMDSNFHADYPGRKQSNSLSSNRLGLIHHLAFKGIRPISSPSTNDYPYLCRNIRAGTYKDAFVTTVAEGNVMTNGYAQCRNLGGNWYFIPPDSRQLWAAALQAVAPNSPRYPFPNPFNFVDGIPFWKPINDPKKRLWELSYDYADLLANFPDDYLKSQETDHEFFFNKERGVLAQPATAWIGGLTPVSSSGGTAGASWDWKPDWTRLLSSTFIVRNAPGDLDSDQPSILFRETQNAGQIDGIISQLNSDTNFTNVGALNWNGRKMTLKSFREAGDLSNIKSRVTKLCRYSSGVTVEYHKALLVTHSIDNWPTGSTQDDCSTLSASNSANSFQATPGTYNEIPPSPPGLGLGSTDLANLTGQDFVEVRQGLRTLFPLLTYHTSGGVHVQNTDKLCRMWKREKKRRAVGNCIVESWNEENSKTLMIGSVAHGYEIAKTARKDTTCHTNGELCAKVSSYYGRGPGLVNAEISAVNTTLSNLQGSPYVCSGNNAARTAARNRYIAYRTRLNTQLACANSAVSQATTTNCINDISNEEANNQSYTPPALATCSENFFGSTRTYNYDFNTATESRCWNLYEENTGGTMVGGLRPESTVNYDSSSGDVGVVKDTESEHSWTWNTDCISEGVPSNNSLKKLPAKCNMYYADLADLHANFCDDDPIDYDNETCVSHKNRSRRKPTPSQSLGFGQQRPALYNASYTQCPQTCTGQNCSTDPDTGVQTCTPYNYSCPYWVEYCESC
ncbi:MAG: hypothetical protein OXK80_02855 [Bdellovibrionales bacterium]|nr:hypothetical protein [Bdellovibrionales bacterium]